YYCNDSVAKPVARNIAFIDAFNCRRANLAKGTDGAYNAQKKQIMFHGFLFCFLVVDVVFFAFDDFAVLPGVFVEGSLAEVFEVIAMVFETALSGICSFAESLLTLACGVGETLLNSSIYVRLNGPCPRFFVIRSVVRSAFLSSLEVLSFMT